MKYKILIVDDEQANLRVLERLFRAQYEVITAETGAEALDLLLMHDVALIISDQRMPGMTGIEFLKRAADLRQHTVRIILTGYTDATTLVEAINSGVVYKYITKPWVNEDLQTAVIRGLQFYDTIKQGHMLKLDKNRLEARLNAAREGLMLLLTQILKLKDAYTYFHAMRTRRYARAIGECFFLPLDELDRISVAAILNETADAATPTNILSRTDSLGADERDTRIRNFQETVKLFSSVDEFAEANEIAAYCNEHFDGSGFPNALAGAQIPLASRIIAAAREYDLLTSPYNGGPVLSHDGAVERLRLSAGQRFDPAVVAAFSRLEFISQLPELIDAGLGDGVESIATPPLEAIPNDSGQEPNTEPSAPFALFETMTNFVVRRKNRTNTPNIA